MIYVDGLRLYAGKGYWCHMWTDREVGELHAFAERLGLKRAWFQRHRVLDHYDLTPAKRTAALKRGARVGDVRRYCRKAGGGC